MAAEIEPSLDSGIPLFLPHNAARGLSVRRGRQQQESPPIMAELSVPVAQRRAAGSQGVKRTAGKTTAT
jgi:hypothetical protein